MKLDYKFILVLICALLLVGSVSANAFSEWSSYGDGWKATNDTYTLIMWNATGSHSWLATGNASSVEYLVVAGGGSGGDSAASGGGGAGGYRTGSSLSVSGDVSVVVGNGGAGSTGGNGNKGGDSTFGSITSTGGGYGGAATVSGGSGGSGGGAGGNGASGGAGNSPSTTPSQGNNGAAGAVSGQGNGGGGAGSAGSTTTGGSGKTSYITGVGITYAEGGSYTNGGTAGTPNSGNGGDGRWTTDAGKAGGSGIVIISYVTPGAPISSFSINTTAGIAPLSVSLTDTSIADPTSWAWGAKNNTGNNTWIPIGTSQNLIYTFGIGTWDINLTTTNAYGSNISTQTTTLKVYPAYTKVYYNTTGSNTFTVPYGVYKISILTVGGGGGGASPTGGAGGGGGGAGGVVETIDYDVIPGETYDVYVGQGGQYGINTGQLPTAGINTTFGNATATITSYGGGGGSTVAVINGSSGGGGLTTHGYAIYGAQGHDGYQTGQTSTPYTAGGGGGAGTAAVSRMGGNGTTIYWITTNPLVIGGGGGGGSYATAGTYPGGTGGGGYGAKDADGGEGTSNTGGGGGGSGGTVSGKHGGKGGNGTVIIGYVEAALVSSFTTNFTSPMVSPPQHDIQFTDTSEGEPTAWDWIFQDVTGNNTAISFASTQNPVHSFGVGNYSIILNASTVSEYSISSQTTYINISPLADVPTVSFTSTTPSGVVPVTVTFTDTSGNYPTSWIWDFAGGTNVDSTLQNPTYTFNTPGVYSINFTAISSAGSNSTIKADYVTVDPMEATATANMTFGIAPLTVGFTGTSTGSPNTYYWDFGDGTDSTLQNPSHTYSVVGTYDVAFKATNTSSGAFDWDNKTSYISVSSLPPVSDFTATPTSGIVPLQVIFNDTTQNSPISWNWSLGDGTVENTRNVTHVYNTAGTYSINLTTTNPAGADSEVRNNYITVNPMVASFSSTNTTGSFEVVAKFTGSSTGTADDWYWEFGDGGVSYEQNPLYTYSEVGNYNVNMKATNVSSGAFDWENKTAYINVIGYQAPVASFTISASDSYVPMTVVFTDTSSNSPYAWEWDFGDGNNSVTQNPTHIYTVPGTYTVSLNVTNAVGSDVSTFSYIHVSAVPLQPQANFSWSNTEGITIPVTVQFTDLSSQSPTSWYWSDFGDGSGATSLLQNPTHNYTNVGAYPVTLSVTNVNGNPSSITKYIQITSTTGGVTSTTTSVGSQTIETLSGSGTYAWTCPSGVYSVSYLLVGGGASGTNGGTTTGYTIKAFDATGGRKGETSTGSIATIPGNVYQFVVGPGGVTTGATSISSIKVPDIFFDATRYTVTNGAGNGGYTYAFGSTANGGVGGLSTGESGSWNVNGVVGTGSNGIISSISGTYVNYGGDGSGYSLIGGIQGGGNGYGYLGGPSTAGSFYGAGGGAGDNTGGTSDIGSSGNNGVIILNYQIISVILPPVANFTGTPLSGAVPLTVQFTDYSTNGPTSWSWNFGDGGTSTEKNPSHTYTSSGLYTVSLTDYNSNLTASGNLVRTNYIDVSGPTPTPTPAAQSSTVWFVPKTVNFYVVDATTGNNLVGADLSAQFISSSALPGGVQDLINYYGMNLAAANAQVDGTLFMNTTSDTSGHGVLTMLQTLQYSMVVTYQGVSNTFTINPQNSEYTLRFVREDTTDTSYQTCVISNGNTWTGAYNDINTDAYNITLMYSYQDTCGLTTSVHYYAIDRGTEQAPANVVFYDYILTPVSTGIYTNNITVPNTRGKNYMWYMNYTRSV